VTVCSCLILAVLRPREGGLRRGVNFGSALLQPPGTQCVYGGTAAGAQCLRLSERFFIQHEIVTNRKSQIAIHGFNERLNIKTVNALLFRIKQNTE